MKSVILASSFFLLASSFVEAPYQFRERLLTVHRVDRRDVALKAAADEYEFPNGVQIAVPARVGGLRGLPDRLDAGQCVGVRRRADALR